MAKIIDISEYLETEHPDCHMIECEDGVMIYPYALIWDKLDGNRPLIEDSEDEAFFRAILVQVFCPGEEDMTEQ